MNTLDLNLNKAGIIICISGTAETVISGLPHTIARGTLCIISPINIYYHISHSDDFEVIEISDEFNVLFPVISSMPTTLTNLNIRANPCIQLNESEIELFMNRKQLLDLKQSDWQNETTQQGKDIITKMMQLIKQETLLEAIHLFLRNQTNNSQQPMDNTETFVFKFIFSLQTNAKTHREVSFYANEAGLSTGYFTSLVKRKTGRTPSQWIATITIVQAKILLQKTRKSIKEIAAELNFPEQFTFRKYFKKHVGISPKEYRQSKSPAKHPIKISKN